MRAPDWEARLGTWAAKAAEEPWEWGRWDCVHAAADWIRLATGREALPPLAYTTAAGALREIGARGGMRSALAAALGEELPSPLLAQRGDVVLVRAGRHECAGVAVGATALVPMGLGAQRVGPGDWIAAWRID